MRILYAMPGYKPAYRLGGPIASVSAAAEMLVRKGHEVTVVTTNANLDQEIDVPLGRPVDVDGVQVWYFRREEPLQKWLPFIPYLSRTMGFLYSPAMQRALANIVPGVDIVDTQMPFVYPTYAASRAALRYGKPLFYHQRGNFDPARLRFRGTKKQLYLSLVERPIMRHASTLIALTEAERESFRSLGVRTHCEIVPNGVDVPAPRPGATERVAQRWGIPPDAQVVLFLARLHPIKGADLLLEAFARIEERCPRSVLVMAGPDEWRLEMQWRERVAQSGLVDHVIFPGMLAGDEKADILARADLFCLPSTGEGMSMAVLEALAHRTAVMLSPGCNFPDADAVGAGVTIPREVGAMAEALLPLLHDRDRLRAMGEAGRRLVAERYAWDAVTDRLLDVYREGMEHSRRAMHATALAPAPTEPFAK